MASSRPIGSQAPASRRRVILIAVAVLLVALIAGLIYWRSRADEAVTYTTTRVLHQDLAQSVTATGTVNAQNTVAVGTQVSGTVAEVFVDFNSHVKKGQILAKLDPTTFEAAVAQAEANLRQAQAQQRSSQSTASGAQSAVGSAEFSGRAAGATASAAASTAKSSTAAVQNAKTQVTQTQAALRLAERTIERDRQLLAQGFIAQNQFDTDNSAYIAAQSAAQNAQTAVTQAELAASASADQAAASREQASGQSYTIASSRAQAATQSANADAAGASVTSAEAQVKQAQFNLERTVIKSPVDGTVVARDVSVGTTVAASLQTPTLFSIAQDLRKMEVDLAVGEPDIGNVRNGKTVNFTVLAYPDRTFHGTVKQVRINPVTTNNVVTYTTTVLVDNVDGKLLPGMTANAQVEVAKVADADVVPLAALTYQPARAGAGRRGRRGGAPGASSGPGGAANGGSNNGSASGTAGGSGTAGSSSGAGAANGGAGAANGATGAANGGNGDAGAWGRVQAGTAATPTAGSSGRIYVLEDGKLKRVPVKILLISGTSAAIETTGDEELDGIAQVVTSDSTRTSATTPKRTGGAANPLLGGGGGGRGGTRGLR